MGKAKAPGLADYLAAKYLGTPKKQKGRASATSSTEASGASTQPGTPVRTPALAVVEPEIINLTDESNSAATVRDRLIDQVKLPPLPRIVTKGGLTAKEIDEANEGAVQRQMREQEATAVAGAADLPLNRYSSDSAVKNRNASRAEDPMALADMLEESDEEPSQVEVSVSGLRFFQGPAAPNRFNIKPGYKWDGIDRSNRFEEEYLAVHHRR